MRPLPMMPLVSHKSREPPHNLALPPLDFFKVADLPPPPKKNLFKLIHFGNGAAGLRLKGPLVIRIVYLKFQLIPSKKVS